MSNQEGKVNKLQEFWQKVSPGLDKTGHVLGVIGKWIYRLRGLFMAVPVALVAFKLAAQNMDRLPESVGLLIQENGTYYAMVTRQTAVMGPLAVTGACLLLMFLSRRTIYPWLISIFTLVLPFVIYYTNVFPA